MKGAQQSLNRPFNKSAKYLYIHCTLSAQYTSYRWGSTAGEAPPSCPGPARMGASFQKLLLTSIRGCICMLTAYSPAIIIIFLFFTTYQTSRNFNSVISNSWYPRHKFILSAATDGLVFGLHTALFSFTTNIVPNSAFPPIYVSYADNMA